jgi:type I restriction enzyme M protein
MPDDPNQADIPEGKIIDFIDGKARPDGEFEQIRQNFERTLVEEYWFDKPDIGVDVRIKVPDGSQTVTRKFPLAVFAGGAEAKDQDAIHILIQIAKPVVQPTDTVNGANELERALIACPNAGFACWTNGLETIYFQKKKKKFDTDILPVNDFPRKGEDASSIFTTDRSRLRVATGTNLLNAFKRCHDFIHANQGGSKEQIFWEFLKMLFAKIQDEQQEGRPRFAIRNSDERNTPSGQKEVRDRVEQLFREVKDQKEFHSLFADTAQGILFNPDVVTFIVAQLEKYDLLHSSVDVKGVAYETIVGPTLEGVKGEFFTPRNVVKMTVKMLDIEPFKRMLDPACATGGFIVVGFNYGAQKLRQKARKTWRNPDKPTPQEEKALLVEVHKASKFIFGLDFNRNLVKTAQMNMVMNNDGRGGLYCVNSLLKPSAWPKEVQQVIELGSMDYVATNPPFGTKIKIEGQEILEQYDLAHAWTKQGDKWVMEGTLNAAMPPEVLFIERCVQFLKPGTGKLGIVVPDGILGNPKSE